MKLLGLCIKNLRKIKFAELDLDNKGNLVQIRGRNRAGKSTVMLAAEILLGGASFIPGDVISHGEDEAKIIGKIGDYTIKRVIKQNGNQYLTIEKEGMKKSKPQEFLNDLSGKFVDPQWFSELSGNEKKKTLMKYLGIDFFTHDEKIKNLEADRVLKGREIKGLGKPKTNLREVEKVDLAELLKQREETDSYNKTQDEREEYRAKIKRQINELDIWKGEKTVEIENEKKNNESELVRLKTEYEKAVARENKRHADKIEKLNNEVREFSRRIEKGNGIIQDAPLPLEKKDTTEITERIQNAAKINREADEYATNEKLKTDIRTKDREYEDIQSEIKKIKKEKEDILLNARMPIDGLEIGDTGLLYNGITDENWSTSEGLKIALHISGALSRELKTMFIKRGESLDSASLNEIKIFAEEHGYQVIIEIVDDSYEEEGDGIIYIEEGEIVSGGGSIQNNSEDKPKKTDCPWLE